MNSIKIIMQDAKQQCPKMRGYFLRIIAYLMYSLQSTIA